jgi:hypothetical protein
MNSTEGKLEQLAGFLNACLSSDDGYRNFRDGESFKAGQKIRAMFGVDGYSGLITDVFKHTITGATSIRVFNNCQGYVKWLTFTDPPSSYGERVQVYDDNN